MRIAGIDPGKNGACSIIDSGVLVEVIPFKADLNICRSVFCLDVDMYFIERVSASPQQGVVSAYTFGKYAESVETAARLTEKEVHIIRPEVWQSALGCISNGKKSGTYQKAKQIFPLQFSQKMFNQESSESTLIALYGYKYSVHNQQKG